MGLPLPDDLFPLWPAQRRREPLGVAGSTSHPHRFYDGHHPLHRIFVWAAKAFSILTEGAHPDMAGLKVYRGETFRGNYTLFGASVDIGRENRCALVLQDFEVARRHAQLYPSEGRFFLEDKSTKGIWINQQLLVGPTPLCSGDQIQIGGYRLLFFDEAASTEVQQASEGEETSRLQQWGLETIAGERPGKAYLLKTDTVRMGRNEQNDVVLMDPSVSYFHAILERQPEGWLLHDLNSTNGTWINGERSARAPVPEGSQIRLGKTILRLCRRGDDRFEARVPQWLEQARARTEGQQIVIIQTDRGCETRQVAETLHRWGSPENKDFLHFHCGAISHNNVLTVLFGGISSDTSGQPLGGLFERASCGTLFLEAVDDLPASAQDRIYQALVSKMFCRVGESDAPQPLTARVLCSVVELPRGIDLTGTSVQVNIPPLRERKEEILERIRQWGNTVSATAETRLVNYAWPGNIEELQNTLERAAILSQGSVIQEADIIFHPPHREPP